jgi:gamma-glutamylcyclotransferase (GGCT)/AIG2-like uncharacterized protein YtfP
MIRAKGILTRLLAALPRFITGREPERKGYVRMFVYGSLKPGFYNFERRYYPPNSFTPVRFGDAAKYVADDRVDGLTLVTLGMYPGAVPGDKRGASFITGMVMDVPTDLAASIDAMEIGAGYSAGRFKTQLGYNVIVYLYENQYGMKLNHIGPSWTLDHQNGGALPWRGQA